MSLQSTVFWSAASSGPSTARSSGALALENLQRFTFGLAFIGVSGFSEVGISVGSLAESAVKAEAIERARRVVLALDHTKVGTTDFARISGLDVVDVVVMDKTTPAVEELCAGYDIELIAAGLNRFGSRSRRDLVPISFVCA